MSNHLDLGCGNNPQNPYRRDNLFGIDIRDVTQTLHPSQGTAIIKANLVFDKIPFEDNFFASVSAVDFLEHIPRQVCLESSKTVVYPFTDLMSEIWRVLSPGGIFLAVTPAFSSPLSFADPTHVNYISQGTHEYFCGERPAAHIYGFKGRFVARIAKLSAPTNYRDMPHNPLRSAVRDLGRRMSKNGLHHMVWELEAVK